MPSGTRWPISAHTRRSVSPPSSVIVNAVSRRPIDSATIIVRPSGVITAPFGNFMSSATTVIEPSGSTRVMTAAGISARLAGPSPRSSIHGSRSKPKLPT